MILRKSGEVIKYNYLSMTEGNGQHGSERACPIHEWLGSGVTFRSGSPSDNTAWIGQIQPGDRALVGVNIAERAQFLRGTVEKVQHEGRDVSEIEVNGPTELFPNMVVWVD